MTLPDERYRAVMMARTFMFELCDAKKTPGVPKAIRDQARYVLRHYPDTWEMQQAAENTPHVFAEKMEPVYRMFKQYEEGKASLDSTDKS
jgi:hypothetical protein